MGFEWAMILNRERAELVDTCLKELKKLSSDVSTETVLAYFAEELSQVHLILPEYIDECFVYSVNPDGTKDVDYTYRQYFFGFDDKGLWPKQNEVLLWAEDIPWLWHFPLGVMSKVATFFENYGAIDIWWSMIADNDRFDGLASKVLSEFFGESAVKNKYPR